MVLFASLPSLLWHQLSVGRPGLLFARGMVAICWRLNLSVPVFQIDRYAWVCVCVFLCMFFASSSAHMFMQAASISSLIASENRKWHMCLSEGLWSWVWIDTFLNSREEQSVPWPPHGWCVGGLGKWEEELEKWWKLKLISRNRTEWDCGEMEKWLSLCCCVWEGFR